MISSWLSPLLAWLGVDLIALLLFIVIIILIKN